MAVMPFYVTLTAQIRDLVPPQRIGRAITSLYLFGLSGAFLVQWLTGLLVGMTADGGRLGSALGYIWSTNFGRLALAPLEAAGGIQQPVPGRARGAGPRPDGARSDRDKRRSQTRPRSMG
jgi:hypothetical protein